MPSDLKASLRNEDDWLCLSCTYNANFIEDLKGCIPSSDRFWSPPDRIWKVRSVRRRQLLNLLKTYSYAVEFQAQIEEADWIKEVFKSCPPQHYARLYKGLISSFHPDIGGSNEVAARINKEYQRVTGGK